MVCCAVLCCSSISFCKAALESINGFDLFAEDAGAAGVIYVDADAHSRNRIVLGHFLPRYLSSQHSSSHWQHSHSPHYSTVQQYSVQCTCTSRHLLYSIV